MSTTEQRVAVVTGAARGIGAATAVRLAAEGRAVAVIDLDEAACKDTVEKITAAGGKAQFTLLPEVRGDGHALINTAGPEASWAAPLSRFLKRIAR